MWDMAALKRGVASGDTTLARFLVNHVDFSRETLAAALEIAEEHEHLSIVQIITTKLQKMAEREDDELESTEPPSDIIDQNCQSCIADNSEKNTTIDKRLELTDVEDKAIVLETPPNVEVGSLETVRTASAAAVEHMISSARQSIALKTVKREQNELVRVSSGEEAEIISGLEMQSGFLATSSQLDDAPTTELRQFSIKVADRILHEGKLVVSQPNVGNGATTTTADVNDMADFQVNLNDSTSGGSQNEHSRPIPSAKQDGACLDKNAELEFDLEGVHHESLSSVHDAVDARIPHLVYHNDTSAATESVVTGDSCSHSDSIVIAENASEKDSDDIHALELEGGDSTEELLPPVTSFCDLQVAVEEEDLATEEPSVAVQTPETGTQSRDEEDPSVSPTGSTIVNWMEHPMSATSEVIETAIHLHEEDRMEVPGKEQCVVLESGELTQPVQPARIDSYHDLQTSVAELHVVASKDPTSSNESPLSNGIYRTACGNDLSGNALCQFVDEDTRCPVAAETASRNHLVVPDDSAVLDLRRSIDTVHDTQKSSLEAGVQFRRSQSAETNSGQGETQTCPHSSNRNLSSSSSTDDTLTSQLSPGKRDHTDQVDIANLPEIPSIIVASTEVERFSLVSKFSGDEIRAASGTSQRRPKGREASGISQRSRTRTANTNSSDEVAEWKNIDLLLNRKRRFFQSQTGSIESIKVPWGEEFATIQALKRFAAQHAHVLRAHIETQLRELDGPLLGNSPRKKRSTITNSLAYSSVGQAREALLLMKDLAFLLKQRLAPFFDSIIPVVMPFVFNTEKRFLCETAIEVLDAMILHCSGQKLALLFLQLGETYSKYEDLRLYNLTSVYVEKCVFHWNKPELALRTCQNISLRHLRDELGSRSFEAILRAHVSQDVQALVRKECGIHAVGSKASGRNKTAKPTESSSPSILQRMLQHRQNRVLPSQNRLDKPDTA
ncbi:hypothetical protein GN958_ATG03973 [Phytophthora infestans]|uniref:Uncharacterized protein n=1 Tax=Phytophthora infestans TaxID=4787 RepID=A0A8S9V091_PHYIN|nr:hypothetical protein GN958_ATG03973 [Phytophthora infestans]